MAMIKILKLTPKQQGLVRRLHRIIKKFEEEGVGTIIQTYDVDFCCVRFYNREKVVWSETEPVEIGECEELLKHEYDRYFDSDTAEKLQKYEKLTWCCPDPEEMYRIPFVSFVGEAPNPWIPVENRDIISFVINKCYIDLFPIKKGGKFGYAAEDRGVIIPCEWKDAKPFSEGYAAVMDEYGYYGYIDDLGEVDIPCVWKDAKPFKDGFAGVMDEDGEWFVINTMGDIYSDMLAPFQNDKDKWGYIDKKGKLVVPCVWKDLNSFAEGLASVQNDDGKWGYIDEKGKLVVPCNWKSVGYFSKGLASVQNDDGKWGYINKKGNCIIPFKWNGAGPFIEGLAPVQNENDKYGYINKKGELIIPYKWNYALSFTKGRARVRDEDDNWLIIDKSGNVVSTDDSDEDSV